MSATNPSRPRRSLFWTTVAAFCALALLVGLGVWQLMRLDWKHELIETVESRLSQPAVALPEDLSDPELTFRRVAVDGTFASDAVLLRPGGSSAGRAGLRVLAALVVEDSDRYLLIDLGWIAIDRRTDPIVLPEDLVRVEGVIRMPEPAGWLDGGNDPASNHWPIIDLQAMAIALGVPDLGAFFVRSEGISDANGQPVLADALERELMTVTLRNDHLQYALTWFALALGLLTIYLIFVRRARRAPDPNSNDQSNDSA